MQEKAKKTTKLLFGLFILLLCLLLILNLRWGDILTNLSLANYVGWRNIYKVTSEKNYIELQLYPIVYSQLNCDNDLKIKKFINEFENFLSESDVYKDKRIRIVFRSAYKWDRGVAIQNYSFDDSQLLYDSFCVLSTNSTSIQILEKLTDLSIIELYTYDIRLEEIDLLKDFHSLESIYVNGTLDDNIISSVKSTNAKCNIFLEQDLLTPQNNPTLEVN